MTLRHKVCAWLGLVSLACLSSPHAFAQSVEASDEPLASTLPATEDRGPNAGDDWHANLFVFAWLFSLEGDIGARGFTADVDADFGEVVEASDSILAFSGRLEVGKGRWTGFVDGLFAEIGADDQSGRFGLADVDVTTELTLIDFGLSYRIAEWEPIRPAAAHNAHDTTLDVYAGGRYTRVDIEVDPAGLESQGNDADWVDPIVGARVILPIGRHWRLGANGDVGGFGVESDFTWSATGVVGYDFTLFGQPASLFFGYRAIGQDFSEGSGDDEVVWDVVLHGPIIGFAISF